MLKHNIVRFWAEILGLQSWYIDVHENATEEDIERIGLPKESFAGVNAKMQTKEADIYVKPTSSKRELEEAIVHEMVHIWIWTFVHHTISYANPIANQVLEQAVNDLSSGLVALRYSRLDTTTKEKSKEWTKELNKL